MGALFGLIRFILTVIALSFVALVAGVLMLIGSLYFLISGRRPQVRVFRAGDFRRGFGGGAGPFGRGPFARDPLDPPLGFENDPFGASRPPMKDVTPSKPAAEIGESQNG